MIYRYEQVDSTNLEAKRLAEKGAPHGSLVIAKRQTAGRGRRGRTWESLKEGNLYFSLLLRPQSDAGKASMLTLVMALAVAKAVEEVLIDRRKICAGLAGKNGDATEANPGIKWPNDIVIGGKKLAGILTEMNFAQVHPGQEDYATQSGYQVIIGVGINVVKQDFTDAGIADKAVSLEEVLGENFTPQVQETLLEGILKYFDEYYENFLSAGNLNGLKEEYESFLVNKNRLVRVLDPKEEYEGKALGINETGELLVETRNVNAPGEPVTGEESVIRTVYAGEVSVRGIYGYV